MIILELEGTPVLNIDISDKEKENNTILSFRCDEMSEQIKIMNDHIKYLTDEVIIALIRI
jgi:hypothetical protein